MSKKILKNKKLFFGVVFILIITFLFLLWKNIFGISMYVGNTFFGDRFYNLYIAEKAFLIAQNSRPPQFNSNYQLGRIQFIKGNFPGAINYFNEEEKYYPNNSKVHYMRGLTYGYFGAERAGILEFEQYIKEVPETWAGRNDMAWLQFRIGDISGAINTISPVIDKQNGNPWIMNSYGTYLLNDGKYNEALISFEKAKETAYKMNEKMWGLAYPGNDPRVYGEGLENMIKTIESNILLTKEKLENN